MKAIDYAASSSALLRRCANPMALIECPDCRKQISEVAPACPNCGRPQGAFAPSSSAPVSVSHSNPPVKVSETSKETTDAVKGCFGCFGLIVIGSILFSVFTSVACPSQTSKGSPTPEAPSETMAFIQCKDFVKARLKSPGSADFPWADFKYAKRGPASFTIQSYVDSQNSFGALIRTNWVCRVTHKRGEVADIGNWTLDDLSLAE